jgi:prefoldin subunit 5
MTELTEQQKHLSQLIEQNNQLATDINTLTNQLTNKRELFLKVQGAIEYLEQTGTTLPEPEPEKKEEEKEESPEKQ